MPGQSDNIDKGGTLRLGAYPCLIQPGTTMARCYGAETISERHRHRYEFNNDYRQNLTDCGLILSGLSPDGRLVETVELPEDVLAKAYETAVRLRDEQPEGCAVLRGIQMEGPFFAASKKGAQNGDYLRAPDIQMFHRLQETARGLIRIADVAPEEPGGLDFVKEVSHSCRVSLAHTAADYDMARAAFEAGASHVTHLFNAMPPLLHRTPGVIGAACENEQVTAELIGDGLHVHPSVVRLAYRAFGPERLCLISDSLSCCGCENGVYWLGGQQVFLDGAIARLADGTIAGSANHLFGILKQTVSMGIPLEDAVRMATYNPAQVLGVEQEVGQIAPGLRADFLVCTPDLQLRQVWLGGKEMTD